MEPNFRKYANTFDFYGFDFAMTDDLKVWLVEVHDYPSHSYLRSDDFFLKLWKARLNT